MNRQQKDEIKLFLAWLFMYGMWMRFWKGPGYPWPTIRINVTNPEEREFGQRCSPHERDEHIFIQEGIRSRLLQRFEADNTIMNWINSLLTIQYNFNTNRPTIKTELLTTLLDRVALGGACMGFAGDTIVQTAYYLIINIFGLKTAEDFNNFIFEMFTPVLDLERIVVNSQLEHITNPNANSDVIRRVQVLTQRQLALQTPVQYQETFNPGQMESNMHINLPDEVIHQFNVRNRNIEICTIA